MTNSPEAEVLRETVLNFSRMNPEDRRNLGDILDAYEAAVHRVALIDAAKAQCHICREKGMPTQATFKAATHEDWEHVCCESCGSSRSCHAEKVHTLLAELNNE